MAQNSVETRPLQGADIDQVVALDQALGGEARRAFFDKRRQALERSPATQIAIVAADGEGIHGYLLANVLTGEFGCSDAVVQIDALGVRPDDQGMGVGRRLMTALKQEAGARGCRELRTQVGWHHQPLVGFFAAAGFVLAPRNVLKRGIDGPLHPGDEREPEEDDGELPPVRSLRAGDLAAIRRIDRHIVGDDREAYLRQKMDEAIHDSGIRISLVGEQEGLVAGFIMARLDYGSFGRTSSTAVIDTIGVDPEYSGSGIGSALMAQLLGNLYSLQVEDVRTEVGWDDFTLNRFLAGCGFRPAQRLALGCPL